jgi:hypothetical protein
MVSMKRLKAIVFILRARMLIFEAVILLPIPRPSGPARPRLTPEATSYRAV